MNMIPVKHRKNMNPSTNTLSVLELSSPSLNGVGGSVVVSISVGVSVGVSVGGVSSLEMILIKRIIVQERSKRHRILKNESLRRLLLRMVFNSFVFILLIKQVQNSFFFS